jgi:hypothetical protein
MEIMRSLKKISGRWTKYGGRVYTIISSQYDYIDEKKCEDWTCQSCGQRQPSRMSPFKFEYPEGEYIRCCGICYVEKCIKLFERLATFI